MAKAPVDEPELLEGRSMTRHVTQHPEKATHRRTHPERGSALVMVLVGIPMLIGMVALAVDLGMMLGARTDSQRVADAAALAGAGSFITQPDDEARARQWALDYAAKNTVSGAMADVRPEDVDVLLDEHKVRVRVRNTGARGNAIRTIFARVLGWDEVDVVTVAAAEAVAAGAGVCPLPIAIPDRWLDNPGGPNPSDGRFDLKDGDKYEPYYDPADNPPMKPVGGQCARYGQPCSVPPGVGPDGYSGDEYTGFLGDAAGANLGDVIEVKTQSGPPNSGTGGKKGGNKGDAGETDPLIGDGSVEYYNASPCVDSDGWRCWYLPDGSTGAANLIAWVSGCPDNSVVIDVGEEIKPETGQVQATVIQAFKNLVDDYGGDGWTWDAFNECMANGNGCMDVGSEDFRKRHRAIPVIDPTTSTTSTDPAEVIRWECAFIEKAAETYWRNPGTPTRNGEGQPGRWNVYIRFARCPGGANGGVDTGSTLKTLRLVE
jgi:Flp pilus assembly protein TadG